MFVLELMIIKWLLKIIIELACRKTTTLLTVVFAINECFSMVDNDEC